MKIDKIRIEKIKTWGTSQWQGELDKCIMHRVHTSCNELNELKSKRSELHDLSRLAYDQGFSSQLPKISQLIRIPIVN